MKTVIQNTEPNLLVSHPTAIDLLCQTAASTCSLCFCTSWPTPCVGLARGLRLEGRCSPRAPVTGLHTRPFRKENGYSYQRLESQRLKGARPGNFSKALPVCWLLIWGTGASFHLHVKQGLWAHIGPLLLKLFILPGSSRAASFWRLEIPSSSLTLGFSGREEEETLNQIRGVLWKVSYQTLCPAKGFLYLPGFLISKYLQLSLD